MPRRWTFFRRPVLVALLVVVIAIVAPVAWYLGSPLFINQVVDEEFPTAGLAAPAVAGTATVGTAAGDGGTATSAPAPTATPTSVPPTATPVPATPTAAPPSSTSAPATVPIVAPTTAALTVPTPATTSAPISVAQPAATTTAAPVISPPPGPARIAGTPTTAPTPRAALPSPAVAPAPTLTPALLATATPVPPTATPMPPTATPVPTATLVPVATPTPAAPVVLRRGSFTRIDAVHWAEGSAVVYRLPDGQRVLRFEGFKAGNGPGLFVYLSGHPKPRSSEQMHAAGAVELASLKGNIGNQNYALPPDLDLAAFRSVVIYCKPFTVVFSTAELGT